MMDSAAFRVVKAEGKTRAGFLARPDAPAVFIKRTEVRSRLAGVFRDGSGFASIASAARREDAAQAGFQSAHAAGRDGCAARRRRARQLSHQRGAREGANPQSFRARTRGPTAPRILRGAKQSRTRSQQSCAGCMTPASTRATSRKPTSWSRSATARCDFIFSIWKISAARTRVSHRRRMLNLVHLDRSIGRFVSRAGRLDFLYAYLGRHLDHAARRQAVAEYLEVRRTVERAHQRRRA